MGAAKWELPLSPLGLWRRTATAVALALETAAHRNSDYHARLSRAVARAGVLLASAVPRGRRWAVPHAKAAKQP